MQFLRAALAKTDQSELPPRRPPGPSGPPILGRTLEFSRDPLGFLDRAHRDYGDIVTLPLNGSSVVAVFGPSQVEAVTSAAGEEVEISMVGGINFDPPFSVQGRGPLNSTGALHTEYREICHRALGRESLKSYSDIAVDETERMLAGWSRGQEVDLLPETLELTHRIFKTYIFGSDIPVTDPELNDAVELYSMILESIPRRVATTMLPFDVPSLGYRRRLLAAMETIDRRVEAISTASFEPPRYSLIRAVLEQLDRAGVKRDPSLTREFVLQLYFAGLTSVASTIAWTLLMISLHPDTRVRLLAELDGLTHGSVPTQDHLRGLPFLDAVLNESMRLYPGSAYEFKRTVKPTEIDGYELGAKQLLLLAPWVTQHTAPCFEDPMTFKPDRFLGPDAVTYTSGAFAPWGTGDRSCIGKTLARNAIRSAVGGIVQRFHLDLVPGQRIDPHPGRFGIRLLPRPAVRVRLDEPRFEIDAPPRILGTVVGAQVEPE